MIPSERRQKLLELIEKTGAARISDLSQKFQVSEMTIHRDLAYLEEHGHVEKRYGGAISSLSKVETAFIVRKMKNAEAKQRIGQAAASIVEDGETIYIDASTTCLAMAPALGNRHNLNIFTTGIATASALLNLDESNKIYCSGGEVSRHTLSITGFPATEFLERVHLDKCFIGGAGVHPIHGVTDPGLEEAEIKILTASRAKELILLVDKTKFGLVNRFTDFPLSEVDLLVTDCEKDDPIICEVQKTGIDILYVSDFENSINTHKENRK